jgi:dinuclear metal center YbgI/SA1388 family protein
VPRLADVVTMLDELYDPRSAERWDAVGLVCGDPEADVHRILFAVDPVALVVDEAIAMGADLVVTHHPLFLKPVHEVAATTPKGRIVHRLLTSGTALHVVHTNADVARPGVSDALADALGLADLVPLDPAPAPPMDKLVTFVPQADSAVVIDALAMAGAGSIGDYERCTWTAEGIGSFRPLAGARPTIGSVGAIEQLPETRVEMVLPRRRRVDIVAALRSAHPYEEPAFDIYELAALPGSLGLGRVGELKQPQTLHDFAQRAAAALPPTAAGIRVAGDAHAHVRTVAVCGGAGDSLLDAVRAAGVDAYVTADLRHHPATEAVQQHDGPALVDAAHWATEWPWLQDAANRVLSRLSSDGSTVEARVSRIDTDPWTLHLPTPTGGAAPRDPPEGRTPQGA